MGAVEDFKQRNQNFIARTADDAELNSTTKKWFLLANKYEYSYHFEWLSRPIIQYPQDIVAMQELIWSVKPDLIVETGIAHGGSLVMSASMLSLLDYCDAVETGELLNPREPRRLVIGVDIDIRSHNRKAIESHPMSHRIRMYQGSSIDPGVVDAIREVASGYKKIMVVLDSNHTHEHVLAELEAYAPLVSRESYCVVFDTVIEDMPKEAIVDRPWGKGNSPKSAVHEYLQMLTGGHRFAVDGQRLSFDVDYDLERKLLITVAPGGYLKRI